MAAPLLLTICQVICCQGLIDLPSPGVEGLTPPVPSAPGVA